MVSSLPTPIPEAISELLLCCRYGEPDDLVDIKAFVTTYGDNWLADAKDESGNTCLHMSGGNGNLEIVEYLLPLLPTSALLTPNNSLSTPLHWISLNYHLSLLRLLCPLLPPSAFLAKNLHGKTPVQEAEEGCESFLVEEGGEMTERGRERVKREVVVGYLLGCMGLGEKGKVGEEDAEGDKEEEEVRVSASREEEKTVEESVEGLKLGEEEEVKP